MHQATSSYQLQLALTMFLSGILNNQPEMGMQKYAWKTEGKFYSPASTFPPRHYMQGSSIYSITTRFFRSKTSGARINQVTTHQQRDQLQSRLGPRPRIRWLSGCSLQTIQGYLEPNLLNAPTRTMFNGWQ